MNIPTKFAHDQKVDSLAEDYLQKGFSVIKEPTAEFIPFDLGGYTPDLLVTKGDTRFLIEIKTKASRYSIDKFQSLAQETAKHDGWRFLLVTLEDVDSAKIPTTEEELPGWPQLNSKLEQALALISSAAIEPALLFLWSIFEAALRKRAIAQNIPIERLPISMLLKNMYSQGEISIDDFNIFLEFMERRNRLAHGANENIEVQQLSSIFFAVNRVLTEWSDESQQ